MLKKFDGEKSVTRIFTRFILISCCFYCISGLMPTEALAAAIVQGQFNSSTLVPSDDASTGLIPLGFSINFFGVSADSIYINNNGNITLNGSLNAFTPFGLTATNRQIIAPFFADVDTRSNSSPVTYGTGNFLGRPAFGVNWINVNCYESSVVTPAGNNSFQLILVDRSDIGTGDFDIIFNYDQILWETGTASGGSDQCLGGDVVHAGFSNGTGIPGTFYELLGSGVSGAFLNGGPNALITNSLNSNIAGRYIFQARNGSIIMVPNNTVNPIPTLDNFGLIFLAFLFALAVYSSRQKTFRVKV